MIKLRALTAYLLERQLVLPEQLDSWTDQVNLELIWKPDTGGLRMGDMRYIATIALERFADHPGRLMALVGSWLEGNDQDRDELSAPKFDITMLDNDLADVDITLEFNEPQYLAAAISALMKPLRQMAKSVTFAGQVFPGEIEAPKDGDIVLVWLSKTKVEVYIKIRPLNCPKDLTANIALDLSNDDLE